MNATPLYWVNTNVFDFQGVLKSGVVRYSFSTRVQKWLISRWMGKGVDNCLGVERGL